MGLFSYRDTMMQIASCSFDAHVLEIVGSLMVGSSFTMLRPYGNVNLEYIATVLSVKQISFMMTVPTLWNRLLEYIQCVNHCHLSTMHSLCSCGECNIEIDKQNDFFLIFRRTCLSKTY